MMGEANLKILAFDSPDGGKEASKIDEFSVLFNPSTFTIETKVEYKQPDAKGQGGGDPVFEKMNRSLGVDAVLLDVDIRASRAHARALLGCGVLNETEWQAIDRGLAEILTEFTPDEVQTMPFEDVHTFVEATLTQKSPRLLVRTEQDLLK